MSYPEPFSTVVHERIAELRRDAAAAALSRSARRSRPARRRWPASVAEALRETFGPGGRTTGSAAPCPTC